MKLVQLLIIQIIILGVISHQPNHKKKQMKSKQQKKRKEQHKNHSKKKDNRLKKSRKWLQMSQTEEMEEPQAQPSQLQTEFTQIVQHLEIMINTQGQVDLEMFGALCKQILVMKHKSNLAIQKHSQMIAMNQEVLQQILQQRNQINSQPFILDRQYLAEGHILDQSDLCHRYQSRLRISSESIMPLMSTNIHPLQCQHQVLSYLQYNMQYYWPMYTTPIYSSIQQIGVPYSVMSTATLLQEDTNNQQQKYLSQYNQMTLQPQQQQLNDQVIHKIDNSSIQELTNEQQQLKNMMSNEGSDKDQSEQEEEEKERKQKENALMQTLGKEPEENLDNIQKDLNNQMREQPPMEQSPNKLHNEEDSHNPSKDTIEIDPFQTQLQQQVHHQQLEKEKEILAKDYSSTVRADSSDMNGYEICQSTDTDYEQCEEFVDLSDDKVKRRRRQFEQPKEKDELEESVNELAKETQQQNSNESVDQLFNAQEGQDASNINSDNRFKKITQAQIDNRFRKITQKQAQEIQKIRDDGKSVLDKANALLTNYKDDMPEKTKRHKRMKKKKTQKNKKVNKKHKIILEQIKQNLRNRRML